VNNNRKKMTSMLIERRIYFYFNVISSRTSVAVNWYLKLIAYPKFFGVACMNTISLTVPSLSPLDLNKGNTWNFLLDLKAAPQN
jgi:hypothetical protein